MRACRYVCYLNTVARVPPGGPWHIPTAPSTLPREARLGRRASGKLILGTLVDLGVELLKVVKLRGVGRSVGTVEAAAALGLG
jgi:hypothetical protein